MTVCVAREERDKRVKIFVVRTRFVTEKVLQKDIVKETIEEFELL